MATSSLGFKLFRSLLLCFSLVGGPTSGIAQALAISITESGVPDPAPSPTASGNYPSALTFEYINEDVELQEDPFGEANKQVEKSNKKTNKSKKSKQSKKSKRSKKGKKFKGSKQSKKGKGYCRWLYQGSITRGAEFTMVGNFSSDTLIRIFEDEASYQAGTGPLQTIEYSETVSQSLIEGHQLGSLSVVEEYVGAERELTFRYLSTTDTNYTDVVINQSQSSSLITGTVDDDNDAYVVISDLRGKGGKCGKALRKCKQGKNKKSKCGTVYIRQGFLSNSESTQALNCRAETLVQVFEDERRLELTEFDTETLVWQQLSTRLVQAQTWRGVLGFAHLQNADQEGFIINLDVLEKPSTTYANVVYQIFADVNGDWELIYNTVGARLVDGRAGSMRLPTEIITLSDLNLDNVDGIDLTDVTLKAIAQIRYDAPDEGRDQQISFDFSETSQNLLRVTQVSELHQLYQSRVYCSRYSRYLWSTHY